MGRAPPAWDFGVHSSIVLFTGADDVAPERSFVVLVHNATEMPALRAWGTDNGDQTSGPWEGRMGKICLNFEHGLTINPG